MTISSRPPLSSSGHVLVVTAYFPPIPGGSSVIMRNLLSHFDPNSYTVATVRGGPRQRIELGRQASVYPIMTSLQRLSYHLDDWWRDRRLRAAISRLLALIEAKQPIALVGLYPSFHFLAIAREAARTTGLPWVAYLHDTIAEGLFGTHLAERAVRLQAQVFAEASSILVMSQGMADLYRNKYGLVCHPLEHTYPEPIPTELPQQTAQRQAFWGGYIYNINQRAVARIAAALEHHNCPFVIATGQTPQALRQAGINSRDIQTVFYPNRTAYLNVLQQQSILVLALDWPDESSQHEDELATIFPTKTPEYLASGRPILVHCPDHYFLARYFRQHCCGLVVSQRSEAALAEAITFLLSNSSEVTAMRQAALMTAQHFSPVEIASRFRRTIESTVKESNLE